MTQHPARASNLMATKWTSATPVLGRRHWEVLRVEGAEAELRSALDRLTTHRLPWRELRDRGQWTPGWISIEEE